MSPLLAPRFWVGHALLAVAVVGTSLLGFWQIQSWQERRAADARDLTSLDPVPLTDLMGNDDPFPGAAVGRPVEVSGTWVQDLAVFVAERDLDGVTGHWMVGVLDLDTAAVPVVLGWVEDPAQAPPQPTGAASVSGWLQPPEGTGAFDDDPTDDVVPQLRVADLQQRVEDDLFSAYVVARDGLVGLPEADLEALPESSRFTALRNLLYGLEWWVFGGFAVLIWWRWVREMREIREVGAEEADPADTVAS